MKAVFNVYQAGQAIEVGRYLKNKKQAKYFNRETAAAIAGVGRLQEATRIVDDTPFYYATGLLEYEDYGLKDIYLNSRGDDGRFSQQLFMGKGLQTVSPLNQFKVLQNMPLSFVSIEFGLSGENAVIYSSAFGLLMYALNSPGKREVLIGASKVYADGKVESGFALLDRSKLESLIGRGYSGEAIEVFWDLHREGAT